MQTTTTTTTQNDSHIKPVQEGISIRPGKTYKSRNQPTVKPSIRPSPKKPRAISIGGRTRHRHHRRHRQRRNRTQRRN